MHTQNVGTVITNATQGHLLKPVADYALHIHGRVDGAVGRGGEDKRLWQRHERYRDGGGDGRSRRVLRIQRVVLVTVAWGTTRAHTNPGCCGLHPTSTVILGAFAAGSTISIADQVLCERESSKGVELPCQQLMPAY